ncbi:MAG: MFS transporter [Bilophila wadsworthia]
MRFFADRTTTLLQIFHVIVDGLYDSVPILLSFMIVAFGAQEKDAGGILSVAALLGTLAGLGTKGCSQRFGFLRTLCLITGAYGVACGEHVLPEYLVLRLFLRHCHDGVWRVPQRGVFISYGAHRALHARQSVGDFHGHRRHRPDSITAFAGFLAAWSVAGIPGWRFVCALFGAVACCITLYLLWTWLRNGDAGGSPCEERKKPQSLLPPLSLLRDRHTASTVVANILDGFSGDQIFAFLPFLLFAKGMDPKVIGSFALAFTVGCFAGKMACGRLVGIFGSRKVFITSKLLMSCWRCL